MSIQIYNNISLNSSECFRQKLQRKSKQLYVQQMSSENCVIYEIMWKNIAKPDRPQTTIQYSRKKI